MQPAETLFEPQAGLIAVAAAGSTAEGASAKALASFSRSSRVDSGLGALELLAFLCIGLACMVPDHFIPWTCFYNETCAAVGLLLLSLSRFRQWQNQGVPRVVWFVLAVAAVPAAQWYFGLLRFSGDVWVSSLYLCLFALAIGTGRVDASADSSRLIFRLAATILTCAVITGFLALSQALQTDSFGGWCTNLLGGARPSGNLAQSNNAATLLGLGAVSLFFLRESGRLSRRAALCLLPALLFGSAVTLSRMALLFGLLVLAGMFLARRNGIPIKTPYAVVAAVIGVQWLLAWLWPEIQELLLLPTSESLGERRLSSPRLKIWPMLVDSLSQVPWHGFGWLQVGEAELAVSNRYPPTRELWLHGHNLFVEFLVWCGYPLGLLLSIAVVYWIASRLRYVNSVNTAFAAIALSLLGLHSMLELPYHYLYFLVPAGLWIGHIEGARQSPAPLHRAANLIPVALALVLSFCVYKDYSVVEDDFRQIRFEARRIGNASTRSRAPDAPFLSTLTSYLTVARMEPRRGMSESELAEMEAMTKRYPYSGSLAQLAVALALNGRAQAASDKLLNIRKIFPVETYRKLRRDIEERNETAHSLELTQLLESTPR